MNTYALNPYLPLNEYVPDGEPRVFGDRVYIYGSHDRQGGDFFCLEDYVVYSAPIGDLANWKYEGISYRKDQDPSNPNGDKELFAPDVVRGKDGYYYLYYCLRFVLEIGVARSKDPQGPFEFYGHVHYENGKPLTEFMPYDPSVLVEEDGRVFLYYGFSNQMLADKFNTEVSPGCLVVELKNDMLTAVDMPHCIVPWEQNAKGTEFEGHAYFEAPSMRHIGDKYYLVYSSQWCRELCYAVSDFPDKEFSYGGVIIDNGDVGIKGKKDPYVQPGNNHGGIVKIKDNYYIFYHRHTFGNSFNRQGCCERISIGKDGMIPQVEVTSAGGSGGILGLKGSYPASISCLLYGAHPELFHDFRNLDTEKIPYISHDEKGQFLHDESGQMNVVYRYFEGEFSGKLVLRVRGDYRGRVFVYSDEDRKNLINDCDALIRSESFKEIELPVRWSGKHPLFIRFEGSGTVDFKEFCFKEN